MFCCSSERWPTTSSYRSGFVNISDLAFFGKLLRFGFSDFGNLDSGLFFRFCVFSGKWAFGKLDSGKCTGIHKDCNAIHRERQKSAFISYATPGRVLNPTYPEFIFLFSKLSYAHPVIFQLFKIQIRQIAPQNLKN